MKKIPTIVSKPCRTGAKVLAISLLPAAVVAQIIINEVIDQADDSFVVYEDFDGENRPWGGFFDLGADEVSNSNILAHQLYLPTLFAKPTNSINAHSH